MRQLPVAHVFLALFGDIGGELFVEQIFRHVREGSIGFCKEAIKYQK
jgi:hypothetical protein